jgi:hypothetical protein
MPQVDDFDAWREKHRGFSYPNPDRQVGGYLAYVQPFVTEITQNPETDPTYGANLKVALDTVKQARDPLDALNYNLLQGLGTLHQLLVGWRPLTLRQKAERSFLLQSHQGKHYKNGWAPKGECHFYLEWGQVHYLARQGLLTLFDDFDRNGHDPDKTYDGVVTVTGITADKLSDQGTSYLFLDVAYDGKKGGYHGYIVDQKRFDQVRKNNMGGRHVSVAYTGGSDESEGLKTKQMGG